MMSSTTLIRWSGAALVIGGILGALVFLFHPLDPTFSDLLSTRWLLVHGLTGVAFLIIIPGLMGLYAYSSAKSGILGLVGFLMALIASILNAGLFLFIESLLMPVAASNPAFAALVDPNATAFNGSLALPLFLGTCVLTLLGFVLFGIAMLRSSDLPPFVAYLIMAGGVLTAMPVPPLPVILNTIGIFSLGVGLASAGYVLWRQMGQAPASSEIAVGVQS
jgi:hypothetical protein